MSRHKRRMTSDDFWVIADLVNRGLSMKAICENSGRSPFTVRMVKASESWSDYKARIKAYTAKYSRGKTDQAPAVAEDTYVVVDHHAELSLGSRFGSIGEALERVEEIQWWDDESLENVRIYQVQRVYRIERQGLKVLELR